MRSAREATGARADGVFSSREYDASACLACSLLVRPRDCKLVQNILKEVFFLSTSATTVPFVANDGPDPELQLQLGTPRLLQLPSICAKHQEPIPSGVEAEGSGFLGSSFYARGEKLLSVPLTEQGSHCLRSADSSHSRVPMPDQLAAFFGARRNEILMLDPNLVPCSREGDAPSAQTLPDVAKACVKRGEEEFLFTFVDLFSGIGGFRLALDRLGGLCLGSCELDKQARQTYELNFHGKSNPEGYNNGKPPGVLSWHPETGEFFHNDITRLSLGAYRGKIDILTGGFPCQSFSTLGTRRGVDDPKTGHLFFHLRRVIGECLPRFFILENVKGLLSIDDGQLIAEIVHLLQVLGYDVSFQTIDAGILLPQRRERVYIVGVYRGELGQGIVAKGEGGGGETETEGERDFRRTGERRDLLSLGGEGGTPVLRAAFWYRFPEVVGEHDEAHKEDAAARGGEAKLLPPPMAHNADARGAEATSSWAATAGDRQHCALAPRGVGHAQYGGGWHVQVLHAAGPAPVVHVRPFACSLRSVLERDAPRRYRLNANQWAICRRQKYVQQHADGSGRLISAASSHAQTLMSRYKQSWRLHSQFVADGGAASSGEREGGESGEGREGGEVGEGGGGGVEEGAPRFLTQRECCRLQGFPERFVIPSEHAGDDGRFYHQIGNAVVPPVIALVSLPLMVFLVASRPERARAARVRLRGAREGEEEDVGEERGVGKGVGGAGRVRHTLDDRAGAVGRKGGGCWLEGVVDDMVLEATGGDVDECRV